jgi:hypothetical protein
VESALITLLSITEKSGNLRKDHNRDIFDSVSTLRNIFVNLNNSVEEQMAKIGLLESEVKGCPRPTRNIRSDNEAFAANFAVDWNIHGDKW